MIRVKNLSFKVELLLAVVFIGAAILLAGKNFYFAANNLYLDTTDALPHYTKIEYMAKCFSQFKWPSWFPYWYNGSTVTQYYPPLSFLLLVPLELIFHNPTVSFKIFFFFSLLLGGMGIWHICYRHIDRWLGILAGIFYVAQPFFTIALLGWGVIAQTPIIALAPWHIIISINYFKNPNIKNWLRIILMTSLLLFSHVMHGFMIALCVFAVLFIASIKCRKNIGETIMWGIGTGLAAGLLGMWWVPGVLQLENPGLPYLAPDAALGVTANWKWFIRWLPNNIHVYYSLAQIVISFLSLIFVYKEKGKGRFIVRLLFILTVFTFVFSFGLNLPLFKYLPLAKNLVPGRILTETAIGTSILSAYFIYKIILNVKIKGLAFIIVAAILAVSIYDYRTPADCGVINNYKSVEEVISAVPNTGTNFEKGRFTWCAACDSIYTYFPSKCDLNILYGWNIEGTYLRKYLNLELSAIAHGAYDYVIKNLNNMNVRSYYLGPCEDVLHQKLKEQGFTDIGDYAIGKLLYNPKKSTYFMKQKRDAIAVGLSVPTFAMSFPWVVEGNSSYINDYKLEDFGKYKMIIFAEPGIRDLKEENYFQQLVEGLSKQGKTVIIEWGRGIHRRTVEGVTYLSYSIGDKAEFVSSLDGNSTGNFQMPGGGELVGLIGLDEVYLSVQQGSMTDPINLIGAKNIGGNKVYFIGGPLSQLLSASVKYLTGSKVQNLGERDKLIKTELDELFGRFPHYTDLSLPEFETEKTVWDYNGCTFAYDSKTPEDVMVSVTYTPRWHVTVDGKRIETRRTDDMLCVDLPAGAHKVEIRYSMTWVGVLGWAVTALSVILILIFIRYFIQTINIAGLCFDRLAAYLEINLYKKDGG